MLNADSHNEPIDLLLRTATSSPLASRQPANKSQDSSTASSTSLDPWSMTLAALRRFSSSAESLPAPSPLKRLPSRNQSCSAFTGDDHTMSVTVTVLERLPNSLFSLRWRDPTLCNYGDQVWVPCVARSSGQCVLSGRHIRRGDRIYKPRKRGANIPLNFYAMIFADELDKAVCGD
jgi:Domain of unknown function (DUF3331)